MVACTRIVRFALAVHVVQEQNFVFRREKEESRRHTDHQKLFNVGRSLPLMLCMLADETGLYRNWPIVRHSKQPESLSILVDTRRLR
jgi:hypothetical protein